MYEKNHLQRYQTILFNIIHHHLWRGCRIRWNDPTVFAFTWFGNAFAFLPWRITVCFPIELILTVKIFFIITVRQRKMSLVEGSCRFLSESVVTEHIAIPLTIILHDAQQDPHQCNVRLPLSPLIDLSTPIIWRPQRASTHCVHVTT